MSKILVVTAERHISQQIRIWLTEFGHVSYSVGKVEQLQTILLQKRFDLVLVDLHIPGTNSLELLSNIKTYRGYQLTPIIVLVEGLDEVALTACFECGATDFITKPIYKSVLKIRIESVLVVQSYIQEIQMQKKTLPMQKKTFEQTHSSFGKIGSLDNYPDISERMQIEEALQQSQEQLRAQYKGIPIPTYTYQRREDDFVLMDYNDAALVITNGGIVNFVDKTLTEIMDRPDLIDNIWHCFHEKCTLKNETIYKIRTTGENRYFVAYYVFVPPDLVMVHTEDITERKQMEDHLTYQAHLLANVQDAILATDEHFILTTWNRAAEEMYGWQADEVIGRFVGEVIPSEFTDGQAIEALQMLTKTGCYQVEVIQFRRDGQPIYVEGTTMALRGEDDRVIGYVSVNRNITERKQVEAQLQASLQEKEVLLKEIHHRVKNNLQIISSLLYLQSQKIQDEKLLELFRESRNRVVAMALIHEKLYQSTDLARINFADYVRDLARSLFTSYGIEPTQVTLLVETGNLALDLNQAVPCGLIINEIISNSLKYAFPAGRGGVIRVELDRGPDKWGRLILSDDGVGMPVDFEQQAASTLGLKLVERLVSQIHGLIECQSSAQGTHYQITFPNQI